MSIAKREVENFLELMLEDESFEDFLERFNLTPTEVFSLLLEEGHVDIEDLKELMGY